MGKTLSDLTPNNPNGYLCFDSYETKDLAAYKKNCDKIKLDLEDTEKTLDKCIKHGAPATEWWADKNFVIGGFAVTLASGVLLGTILANN